MLFLILAVQAIILNHIHVFGVSPMILPAVISIVAIYEGPEGGSGFGLLAGVLYETAFSFFPGLYIITFTLIGAFVGMITDYLFPKNFVSCIIFSFAAHFITSLVQIIRLIVVEKTIYMCMLTVAGTEILFSLAFCGPIYLLIKGFNRNAGEI